MNISLAENIRACRKARGLTQEQLAEVLGATVGAVHKWETRLSVPELPLIVEMADFFDTSVDALLGYEMRDNRLDETVSRIWRYHAEKNRDGLGEVEKALKKYPHAFPVAFAGATLYHGIGLEAKEAPLLRRALELYEKSRQLLPQNRDTSISEQTLCGSIAGVHFALGERERAVELLREQNAGNLYSAMIGEVLATELNRPEEAEPYLSRGLMHAFNALIYVVLGYSEACRARRDPEGGQAMLVWGIRTIRGLKASDKPDFIDKLCAYGYARLAGFQLALEGEAAARESLRRARALARAFDDMPDYSCRNLRFLCESERGGATYDILGTTALEAVENALHGIGSKTLNAIWKELNTDEA